MKKIIEVPTVNKSCSNHDALLVKKRKTLFSAVLSLSLRGGKADIRWHNRGTDAKQTSIEESSRPRRRYDKCYGLNSSRGIFMAHFSDKCGANNTVWRFNGVRYMAWSFTCINFGVFNCGFLFVAGTALPWCWSRQFVLLCSKSLTWQRKQQHFGQKRKVRCRLDFAPLLLGLSRSHGCSNVHPTYMDFIGAWI